MASNGDRDGIPNVIPEAMSAGSLILASCYAGASEAFIDGVSGFSLNPKEPYTWVELIEDFAQNPLKYEKVRKKAQLEVRDRFNIKQTARKLIQNFEQIACLMKLQVSIIISVLDQLAYTKRCLKSIEETLSGKINYEVLIVDDCSNDQTIEFLRSLDSPHKVFLILKKGLCKNNNFAASEAR